MTRACETCGQSFQIGSRERRRRRFCSERCRKAQYAGTCERCGAPTNGHNGPGKAGRHCAPCAIVVSQGQATWTRERILAEGRRWFDMTGRWPLAGDWNRQMNRGERRHLIDRLHELTGPWPHVAIVQRKFGTWRAFVEALGGQAHPLHSGGGAPRHQLRLAELRAYVAAAEREHMGAAA